MIRRRILPSITLFTILCLTASAQNAGDRLFAGITVHTIKLQMSQPNFWDSLVYYYNQGFEQYMAGTVTLNDTLVLDSVGVRLKGNSSFTHPNNKKSIRLSFDEYRDAQRCDGEKGLHLNNCWGDPSFMREKMHLDFLRDAGIPGPRANYANVYINGQLWGLYSMVEHVDKTFLAARYGDKNGNLYKAVDGFGLSAQYYSDFRWYGGTPDSYSVRYELKTDESTTPWTDLISLIDSVNNAPSAATAVPAVLDLTSFARAMAADNLFANLDSYLNSARNFYIYFLPATRKMEWVVWDTGLSFGAYAPGLSNLEALSITYLSSASSRPLLGRVLATPALKNEYLKAYSRLFTGHFSSARLLPHADSIANVIRASVTADPKKMYTVQQFETNINSAVNAAGGAGMTKPGIKAFITAREASVQTQLAAAVIDWREPVPAGAVVINEFMASNDSITDPAGEAEDWIELYNRTGSDIDLGGALLSDDAAVPATWSFPDGTVIPANGYLLVWADEDAGQAGLHAMFTLSAGGESIVLCNADSSIIDSVSFGAQTLNISRARIPDGTGAFVARTPTPGRANDGPSIPAGAVVINEFLASNALYPDPAGENEDYVELYNTTDVAYSLAGMHLTDSYGTPGKWTFPSGTTIAAKSYLMVWCDEDEGQAGVHTSFKLSADGEQVMLTDAELKVIDSVTFGAQTANTAMARIPNGSGAFQQAVPTPGAANPGQTSVMPEPDAALPAHYGLSQNHPNPFNPSTEVRFQLPAPSSVRLAVYDILGKEVAVLADGPMAAGHHSVRFSAPSLSSGLYLYRITAGPYVAVRRMVLLK